MIYESCRLKRPRKIYLANVGIPGIAFYESEIEKKRSKRKPINADTRNILDLGPDIQLVQTSRNSKHGDVKANIQAAELLIGPTIKESRLCKWLYNTIIYLSKWKVSQSNKLSETDIASVGKFEIMEMSLYHFIQIMIPFEQHLFFYN